MSSRGGVGAAFASSISLRSPSMVLSWVRILCSSSANRVSLRSVSSALFSPAARRYCRIMLMTPSSVPPMLPKNGLWGSFFQSCSSFNKESMNARAADCAAATSSDFVAGNLFVEVVTLLVVDLALRSARLAQPLRHPALVGQHADVAFDQLLREIDLPLERDELARRLGVHDMREGLNLV